MPVDESGVKTPAARPPTGRWRPRDLLAAALLFAATSATVLWQNAHVAVLWDISYLLDSSYRFALGPSTGQMPYRDFPFVHAPLTFLIQAAIIRLTGRVFFHQVLYAAIIAGLGTVLTWRMVLHALAGRLPRPWAAALLLAAPLTVLGVYGIFPTPFYDCDCIFFVLIAVWLLQHAASVETARRRWAFAAGCACVLPVFCKQNIGGPFLLAVCGGMAVLLLKHLLARYRPEMPNTATPAMVLAGAGAAMLAALLALSATAGLRNYLYWTVRFAGQRRLPGLGDMLDIYREPSLLWALPCVVAGAWLLHTDRLHRRWTPWLALALMAAPLAPPLLALVLTGDAEDRASSLLALWPLLLVLAAVQTLWRLRHPGPGVVLPLALLAAVHGTMLSQQLWGSTYAIWPLFVLLLAGMLASLPNKPGRTALRPLTAYAALAGFTLLLCGGLYTFSEDRLSYAQLSDGPLTRATHPALRGMATPGPWLPAFEQLLDFTAREVPWNDGIVLIPGEDPFYFATGRTPRFPVLLFDRTTDPYTPAQLVEAVRAQGIRWLIVKRNLQLKDSPLPWPGETLPRLTREFALYRRLDDYDVYRRR